MKWKKLVSKKTQVNREEDPKCWSDYPISNFEKDYKSIISSAAFRRLQDKTQVFPLDKSDFVRTRLTHSVEVSTIAKQLGIMLTENKSNYAKNEFKNDKELSSEIHSILSCAGLLHDLGNPPFGHFGEVVIRDWFRDKFEDDSFTYKNKGSIRDYLRAVSPQMVEDLKNFEGNAQALRILLKIRYNPEGYDINLTYSVMNTLIKYPTDSTKVDDSENADVKLHKLGYFFSEKDVFHEICNKTGTKLENGNTVRHPLTFLMEASDDIAYATSDLEDALKKRKFTVRQFIDYYKKQMKKFPDDVKKEKSGELIQNLEERIGEIEEKGDLNQEKALVAFQKWTVFVKGWLMYVVSYSFSKNYNEIMEGTYKKDMFADGFHEYTIKILKGAMAEFVFNSSEILKLELSAQKKYIHLISENYKNDYLFSLKEGDEKSDAEKLYLRFLMVTDFISGMTDSYAKNLYQELNGIV